MRKVFNLRNIYSATSFGALLLAPGAAESEMYILASALIVGCGLTAYLALREDGFFRQKNRPR